MTRLPFALVLGAAWLGASATAAPDLASDAQRALPGTQVVDIASGDLDGDGAIDAAALVRGPAADDAFYLVALRAQPGGLVEWARSANVGPFPKGLPALSIERRSIVFDTSAATCCERSTEHHQFQFRDGRFRLIGVSVLVTGHGSGEPRAVDDVFRKVDWNLLTGDRVEELRVRGRKPRSQKSRETPPAPRWLETFSGLLDDPGLAQVLAWRLR